MWEEQLSINLQILYLCSIILHNYVKKHKVKNLVFVRRDCCHWWKIYNTLYPGYNVHYFHSSRNLLERATNESLPYFDEYIYSITFKDAEHSIYIDIHGSGLRMYNYFSKRYYGIPLSFILYHLNIPFFPFQFE